MNDNLHINMDNIVPTTSSKTRFSTDEPHVLHNNNNLDVSPLIKDFSLESSVVVRSEVIIRSLTATRDRLFGAGNKYSRKQSRVPSSKCAIRQWDEHGGIYNFLKGHLNSVAALTTWNNFIVSASYDCSIRVWDNSGTPRVLQDNGHSRWVLCLTTWQITENMNALVSGSSDNSIKLWNTSGDCTATFCGHTNSVSALAVCNTTNTLWSGSWDRTLKIWDTAGNCVKTLYAHDKNVTALCELGALMISGADDTAIILWHHDGNPLKILKGHTGGVLALCPFTTLLNRNRVFFSGSADNTIRAWDEEGRLLGVLKKHTGSVTSLMVWNNKLWSGSWDKSVICWSGLEFLDDSFMDTQSQSLSQHSPSQSQSSQENSPKSLSPTSSQERGKKRRLCDEQVVEQEIPESPKKSKAGSPVKEMEEIRKDRDRLQEELEAAKKVAADLEMQIQVHEQEKLLRNALLYIKYCQIEFLDNVLLGKGGSSQVRRGRYHGMLVAVKQLMAKDPHFSKQLQREVSILRDCTHQNIVTMIGACVDPEYPLCVVTEFMEKGSLFDYLHKTDYQLAAQQKILIAKDVAAGLAFLHSRNIIHQDIKSSNILLDKKMTAKICDFGFSTIPTLLNVSSNSIGPRSLTVCYEAPEYALNQEITTKSDCFSFGILLWEIAAREVPFLHCAPEQIKQAIATYGIRPELSGIQKEYPQMAELMRACWSASPASRPSLEEAHTTLDKLASQSNHYDLFLSHYQKTGSDLARSIKFELLKKKPHLITFLDVDDLNQIHDLENAVSRSRNLLLLLTEGVLERPFVQLEIRTALRHNVNIIPVHDLTRCTFPNIEFIAEENLHNITREELRQALMVKAIPFLRDQPHRDLSIDMILEHMNH